MAMKALSSFENMPRKIVSALCALMICSPVISATAAAVVEAPTTLSQWRGWIEQSNPNRSCANQSAESCLWMGPLSLVEVSAGKWRASFEASNLSASALKVYLPGDEGKWPTEARVGSALSPIGSEQGRAYVELRGQSSASISVEIDATRANSSILAIPPSFAIAKVRDASGKERLVDPSQGVDISGQSRIEPAKAVDATKPSKGEQFPSLRISRLIQDAQVPLMTTKIKIENGGQRQNILIEHLLPEGSVAVQMNAPGAQLSSAGLSYEAPAGASVISIVSRLDPGLAIKWAEPSSPNAKIDDREYVFIKSDERVRKISANGKAVDPKAIDASLSYMGLAAYERSKESPLSLSSKPVERLGVETRANARSEAWLDFAGDEVFMKQSLSFERVSQGWFEPQAGWQATQATASGQPAIVAKSESGDAGRVATYEGLRELVVGMKAPASLSLALPAIASDGINATNAETTLRLPLGWRVMAVLGAGYSDAGWLASMTLWDWFLVIVSVWAAKSLLGWRAASTVLGAMLLGRLFLGAPFGIYLPLLCLLALARHLPTGGFKTTAYAGALALAIGLLANAAPFSMSRIQKTLHTSLEDEAQPSAADGLGGQWRAGRRGVEATAAAAIGGAREQEADSAQSAPAVMPAMAPESAAMMKGAEVGAVMEPASSTNGISASIALPSSLPMPSMVDKGRQGPKRAFSASVEGAQAGEGEPSWTSGMAVRILHSGPSSSKTVAQVILIPPWLAKILGVLAVACLWASAYFMGKHALRSRAKSIASSSPPNNADLASDPSGQGAAL